MDYLNRLFAARHPLTICATLVLHSSIAFSSSAVTRRPTWAWGATVTEGGLSLKAVCFEVGRALDVAKGIDDSLSLAFSKLSGLRSGVFFFLLNLVIFNLSGDRYDTIDTSVNPSLYGNILWLDWCWVVRSALIAIWCCVLCTCIRRESGYYD